MTTPSGQPLSFLRPGEAARVAIQLSNNGTADADDVRARLSSDDGLVDVTPEQANAGPIAHGQDAIVSFDLSPTGCARSLGFTLTIQGAANAGPFPVTLDGRCPGVQVDARVKYDDSRTGNGDGVVQPGETIELFLTIFNFGDPLTGISVTLTLQNADPMVATVPFPDLDQNHSVTNADPFVFKVRDDAPTNTIGGPFAVDAGGCAVVNGDETIPVRNGVQFVVLNGSAKIRSDQGGGDVPVGTAAVCPIFVENLGTRNPLAETGVDVADLGGVGAVLLGSGVALRRRRRGLEKAAR